MYEFWLCFCFFILGALAMAAMVTVWDMLLNDEEDERAAAAARLSLLRRIPPEVYEELAEEYPERKNPNVVL